MKSRILIAILMLSTWMVSAQNDESDSTKNLRQVIKSNPFYSMAGWLPLTYELFVTDNKSIVLGASYITNPPTVFMNMGQNFSSRSGYYINPAFRFYLFKTNNTPGGFYASPEVGYIFHNRTMNSDSIYVYDNKLINDSTGNGGYYDPIPKANLKTSEFQIGATIGYQLVVHRVFVLDVYAGQGMGIVNNSGDVDTYNRHMANHMGNRSKIGVSGARLMAGFKIGVAF